MVALARAFWFSARRGPVDPGLLEEAYGARESAVFRQIISRIDYEKIEINALAAIENFPLLRRQLTRSPDEDPNVIPNRLALILLAARAHGKFRKYDKTKPAYLHSLEVTEIFLGIARRMRKRGALITPVDRIRGGVRRGFLHDIKEDFKTTIAEIGLLFGKLIAKSVDNMSTPNLAELVKDEKYRHIVSRYVTVDYNLPLGQIEEFLKDLETRHPSTHENLKASLKLEFKVNTATQLSLVECLLRGSDNVHWFLSNAGDLRKRNIFISRRSEALTGAPAAATGFSYREMRDNITDREDYQNALDARFDQLGKECKDPKELHVLEISKEELRAAFEKAKKKLQIEMDVSMNTPNREFRSAGSATLAWRTGGIYVRRMAYTARTFVSRAAL